MVDETSVAVNASQASAKVYSTLMGAPLKNLTEHDTLLMVDETSLADYASQASAKVYSKQMGDRQKNLSEHDEILMVDETNLTGELACAGGACEIQ